MVNVGISNWFFAMVIVATACVWNGCTENQDEADNTSKTKPVAKEAASNPSAPHEEPPVIRLEFISATYRLMSDTACWVTVHLAASSSRAKVSAYLRLPYAYKVQSSRAMSLPITVLPGKDSPEMHLYTLTTRPQDVFVRPGYQFNLQPDEVKESKIIEFRLRYSYEGITSNWIDCQAVRETP